MKLDKETIVKQRFWFLLLVAVPLILGAFFILMTTVRAAINANRKKLDGDLKSAGSGGVIRNQEWVDAMEKKAKEMAKIEEKVWREAYEEQKDLSTWPQLIEENFDFKDGLFATEIKVERGKGVSGKLPANDASHFHGVVLSHNRNEVVVKGEEEKKTFHNTAKIKVSGDKTNFFRDLQDGDRVAVTYIRSKYFFDPLTDNEQKTFADDDGYKSQVPEILEQVQPLTVDSEGDVVGGVVQFKNWTYQKKTWPPADALFFRYVARPWKTQDHNISDEAWMAQEDLWLQREIYRIIREANDSVSKFKGDGGDAKDSPKTYVFTNPYWELTLTFVNKKRLGIQIKNLLPRRQRLDLDFLVQLQKKVSTVDQLEKITIGGEPLGPLETREMVQEHDVQGQAATGIYGVEQVINWETAAVKRIDQVSLGSLAPGDCAHGHRTYPAGLKPFKERKETGAKAQQPPGPGGPKMDPKMLDKAGFKGVKEGSEGSLTVNGLKADRYLEPPTRQTRRIPVGVALIVDQEHVDRVLLAFSKSHLRFVTTQVILNRYPNSVRPSGGTAQPKGKGGFGPKDFGFGEGTIGPGLGGVRHQPAASSGSNQESNIELVIYGIMTMYERYPPRPQQTK